MGPALLENNLMQPVLDQIRHLNARALRILTAAENTKDHVTALSAIREVRHGLELVARLTGELDPRAAGETPGAPLQVTVVYAEKAAMVFRDSPAPAVLPETQRLTGAPAGANTEAS
jgi:hypothetical protein